MSSTRITVRGEFSDQSDFADPKSDFRHSFEATTNTKRVDMEGLSAATSSGTAVDLSATLSACEQLFFRNNDSTNFVTISGQSNSVAFSLRVDAGRAVLLPDVTVGTNVTMVADTSACLCDLYAWGT